MSVSEGPAVQRGHFLSPFWELLDQCPGTGRNQWVSAMSGDNSASEISFQWETAARKAKDIKVPILSGHEGYESR